MFFFSWEDLLVCKLSGMPLQQENHKAKVDAWHVTKSQQNFGSNLRVF